MCLAVPARVLSIDAAAAEALADLHGNRLSISTVLVPDAQVGDWVLIHAGFAIQKLEATEASETFAILSDLKRAEESSPR
jgi:hydrogenase expression/formation protein HypC